MFLSEKSREFRTNTNLATLANSFALAENVLCRGRLQVRHAVVKQGL
jgi:hypothetical protein